MNISAPFIRRPVATSLLTAAILIAGIIAFQLLPLAPLPEVQYPVISVNCLYPGGSPDTLASAVATPLERMFGRIAGINQMTSVSQTNSTNITLQFDLSRDIDGAGRDVQAAINAARGFLPPELPANPTWRETNPAEAPVMVLALTSETATAQQLFDAGDSILAQKLQQITGVGVVNVGGSSQPAVRAEINPLLFGSLGVGVDDVRNAIDNANANMPKGMLSLKERRVLLSDNDQLLTAKEYEPLIIGFHNGAPVRLKDVSYVIDDEQNVRAKGFVNGKLAVVLQLYRQPSANIIATADRVMAVLPQLRASIPPAINLDVVQDRTTTIRASVHDIEISMAISVVLVILVVLVFLHRIWATMIPSITVPLSLTGTFAVMYLAGYSIDNLSLMALTISTGFVVDDAIVVIENITRYLEQGMRPMQAALKGAGEIGFTVLSMSTSLIAVFIPILLMSGLVGRIFREFAVTLAVAVALSMVISLTTTPMLCAKLLRAEDKNEKQNLFARASVGGFDWLARGYARSLRWVLNHQPFMLGVMLGTVALAVHLYIVVPKGFFPQQDTGRLTGNALGSEDVSFVSMTDKIFQYVSILQKDPAIDVVTANTGGRVNIGNLNITLKPLEQRKVSADVVINRLRSKLAVIPGSTLFLQSVQDVQIGARASNAQYQYTLQADNLQDMLTWSPRMLDKLRVLPELRDVNSDLQARGLLAGLVIDRATASRLNITPSVIDNVLYDSFGQRQIATTYREMNQYHVVLEVSPKFKEYPDAISRLYVKSSTGAEVPVSAFTHYEPSVAAIAVAHQGQYPAATLSFNLAPNVPLGDAVAAIQKVERNIGLPTTIHPSFQGTAQAFQDSLASQPYLILAALVSVYIVLGMLYENYIHPITILSTLPSAGVGALLALLAFHAELTVIAMIGIILLIGIVKKNAILMIDFALEAERNEGNTAEESIYKSCLLRFRPIMMTTMAAMFGGVPLAVGTGEGSELRRPLGIAIVGGLIVSQMLTLYTTPVVYIYMDRLRAWVSGGKKIAPIKAPALEARPHPAAD